MKLLSTLAAGALSLFASSHAAELVVNGSFTNDLNGWTCVDADLCDTNGPGLTDNDAMRGFDNNGFGTLSQSIATTAGTSYDFSFWSFALAQDAGNILRYRIDGGVIETVATTSSYAQTTDMFVASGATALIEFFFETDPGTATWRIDDVSVMASAGEVPLPGALPLMAAGLGLFAAKRREKNTA